jgi:hypothetical protein
MKLGSATDGDVVQNVSNRSFYRFARLERSRARIRPLEHFPNGRLIPKPTDTLVDADLVVALVGPWSEGMVVEGSPTHQRPHYEKELQERVELLSHLEAAYEALPRGGTGRQSRGSWANKVNNCRARVATLQAGLEELDEGTRVQKAAKEKAPPVLALRDLVQLPSGRPGLILSFERVGGIRYAHVRTRLPATGQMVAPVPIGVLRPWSDSQLCTL